MLDAFETLPEFNDLDVRDDVLELLTKYTTKDTLEISPKYGRVKMSVSKTTAAYIYTYDAIFNYDYYTIRYTRRRMLKDSGQMFVLKSYSEKCGNLNQFGRVLTKIMKKHYKCMNYV